MIHTTMDGSAVESTSAAPNILTSKLFCDPTADITFISSDHLPEHSQVLEILFQFIEPSSADHLKLDIFFALAEAAEKYIVPSAMNICLTRMPLVDQAAKYSLSQPLDMVVSKLTAPGLLPRWLLYYKNLADLWGRASAKCNRHTHMCALYHRQIVRDPSNLYTMPTIPDGIICTLPGKDNSSCLCNSDSGFFKYLALGEIESAKFRLFSTTTM
ncbi:hypothetical protein BJ912DRAFT_972829 [Pholiota molesta]|nr:hypothetical protein BJ912DRAFT_972829 [Pholiota molesta]